jgi:hypothetical protein
VQLLFPVELFFLAECRIFERSIVGWKRSSVSPLRHSRGVQDFQVFSDGDLGGVELLRQVGYENPAIALQDVKNGATAFLVEHVIPETGRNKGGGSGFPFRFLFISFPFVCPEPAGSGAMPWAFSKGGECSWWAKVGWVLSLEHHTSLHYDLKGTLAGSSRVYYRARCRSVLIVNLSDARGALTEGRQSKRTAAAFFGN